MARGGARTGTPGTAYSNRSDLNSPKPPIARFTDEQYGEQAAQVAQQQALGPPETSAAAPSPVAPGSFGDFGRPTERPDEPITAAPPMMNPTPTVGALLSDLGRTSPAVAQLAAYVASGRS